MAILNLFILFRKQARDNYVYREGETNNYIYIIVNGAVDIETTYVPKPVQVNRFVRRRGGNSTTEKYQKKNLRQRTVCLIRLTAGNYFGAEAGLWEENQIYSVQIVSDVCNLLLLPFDVFYQSC